MAKADYLKLLGKFSEEPNALMKKSPETRAEIAHNIAIDNPSRSAWLNSLAALSPMKQPVRSGVKTAKLGAAQTGYELNAPPSPENARRRNELQYKNTKRVEPAPRKGYLGHGLDW